MFYVIPEFNKIIFLERLNTDDRQMETHIRIKEEVWKSRDLIPLPNSFSEGDKGFLDFWQIILYLKIIILRF